MLPNNGLIERGPGLPRLVRPVLHAGKMDPQARPGRPCCKNSIWSKSLDRLRLAISTTTTTTTTTTATATATATATTTTTTTNNNNKTYDSFLLKAHKL